MKSLVDLKNELYPQNLEVWGLPLPLGDLSIHNLIEELGANNISNKSAIGEKRWNEFCSGRICAIKGAHQHSLPISWLDKNENGSPNWPRFLRGSISHSKSWAISVTAKSCDYISIGCDIEEVVNEKRIEVIKRMIITEKEHSHFKSKIIEDNVIATILFSAKESLYKMMNPLTNQYLNFHEGILKNINFDEKTFHIELRSNKQEYLDFCGEYKGHFSLFDNNIMTILTLKKLNEIN